MKQTVKFSPGSCAAVLLVKHGTDLSQMWIYMSEVRNPECTGTLFRELHPDVEREITLHFTKVFDMEYTTRAEYMKTVRPWEIQIDL